ncbi:GNAT family N-acetyltransferase [Actinomadura flavalba]|uniref:GNAT family N-acetyltransferase n=1 Tax=Actinomadura flavalba TaxID=1120938 RepID=UPI0003629EE8|nr:GNAT family N-acetyltransferase [Actinomadura flavalba]
MTTDPQAWRPGGRPPERFVLGAAVLRRWRDGDAPAVDRAVTESFTELHAWMAWATAPSAPGERADFVRGARRDWDACTAFSYGIFAPDGGAAPRVLGGCALHARGGPGVLEIGYWVHSAHTGRGLATGAAGALTRAGLALPGVRRLEIHCDVGNAASAAVARRLGYTLAGCFDHPPVAHAETGRRMRFVLAGGPRRS